METEVYLRDIKEENQTDAFFGKGLEDLKAQAKALGREVIVGYFIKPKLE